MAADAPSIDPASVERFAGLALACVHQEYPNKIAHVMASDADVGPPRELTPSFYGCFDWHSCVHGHWLLVRLAQALPGCAVRRRGPRRARDELHAGDGSRSRSGYLNGEGRASFERPYGLAWLLCLTDELRSWPDEQAQQWATNLAPLEQAAVARLREWLPKLHYPIRTGEHSQTAFAFGLVLDWARPPATTADDRARRQRRARFYLADVSCPSSYEPSGEDFLSPCLAEADLMRRVLPPAEYATWLGGFLPRSRRRRLRRGCPSAWSPTAPTASSPTSTASTSSRAWMLEGILAGLPERPAPAGLQAAADAHRAAGLAAVTGEHYEGGHWLGSFATYLVTARAVLAGTGIHREPDR